MEKDSRFGKVPALCTWGRALLIGMVGCAPPIQADPNVPKDPNVILISLDTVRADHLGCYGNPRLPTPNLDRLATQGARFEYFYSAADFTLSTHASLFSGLYPSAHGTLENDTRLSPHVPNLAQLLSESGYRTVGFYDQENHYMGPEFSFDRGFDSYDEWAIYDRPEDVWEETKRLVEAPQPFFLFVHINSAHEGYVDPRITDYRFVRGGVERAIQGRAAMDTLAPQDYPPWLVEHVVDLYNGSLAFVDAVVAQLVSIIDVDPSVADQTAIFVTGDHGQALGSVRGCCGHGYSMYQEQTRVPLIIRFPDQIGHAVRIAIPASTVDIPATILDLAGLRSPAGTHGVSLLPFIKNPLENHPTKPVAFSENPPRFAYRSGHWSIVGEYFHPERLPENADEVQARQCTESTAEGMIHVASLHDIRVDPYETHNSQNHVPGVCASLVSELRETMRAGKYGLFAPEDAFQRALRTKPLSPEAERSLRAFGYIE